MYTEIKDLLICCALILALELSSSLDENYLFFLTPFGQRHLFTSSHASSQIRGYKSSV